MPSQKNINQLKDIKDKLETISSMILVDYSGVPVADQQALRSDLIENENSFSVTKNTLISLALQDRPQGLPRDLIEVLRGPTAVIYAKDLVSAAKTISDFAKKHESFTIKAGISLSKGEDRLIATEEIEALSKLPSKDQLYAQLLSQLNAPAQSLVRVLTAPMQNLVYVLQNHVERG